MKMNTTASWQSALGLLALRLFAAYEFWESGMQKWNGENWFAEINDQFPFPFYLLPDSVNWNLAMWPGMRCTRATATTCATTAIKWL